MKTRILAAAENRLPRSEKLSCITYSNAGSGLNTYAQILWFIFRNQETVPVAVAKTVRDTRATAALAQSYANVQTLHTIEPSLFAKPLHHEEDISMEMYVSGVRHSRWTPAHIEQFLNQYTAFQEKARVANVSMQDTIESLARALLAPQEADTFLAACARFFPATPLPGFVQHGDLTRDNVLFARRHLYIVDYEHAHLTTIPGYDIYNLFSRMPGENPVARLRENARALRFAYDDNHLALFPALHELLEAQKKSGRIRTPVVYLKTLLSLLPA